MQEDQVICVSLFLKIHVRYIHCFPIFSMYSKILAKDKIYKWHTMGVMVNAT